jgi:surface antigen
LHLFRNYSAFAIVFSSAFLVSATNLAAGRESSGFLFGYFGENENYENPLKDMMFLKTTKKTSLAMADLSQAKSMPDPKGAKLKRENEEMIIQGQALVAGNSPVKKDPEEDGGVVIYEVQDGDTVSAIAAANGISTNTILWSNELANVDEIQPGDKIFILPVSGLKYTVKTGDTIEKIAEKYKGDEEKIIAFNDLPANGDLEVGQEITIPDGRKEVPVPTPSANSSLNIAERPYESFSVGKKLDGKAGTGHKFPYGYCTWYVAQKKYVPWGGNAGTWLYHAKAAGYSTGKTPRVGSIMVTSESWWGHVAIVEKVSGSNITVSEMNYKGFAVKSKRTLSSKSRVIKGFIY